VRTSRMSRPNLCPDTHFCDDTPAALPVPPKFRSAAFRLEDQTRLLKRQPSFPVSMMSQWGKAIE